MTFTGPNGSTLQLLRHLLDPTERGRLCFMCTYRDTEPSRSHPLADALADLRRHGRLHRVRLGGIDERAVAEVAVAWTGGECDPAFVARVPPERRRAVLRRGADLACR